MTLAAAPATVNGAVVEQADIKKRSNLKSSITAARRKAAEVSFGGIQTRMMKVITMIVGSSRQTMNVKNGQIGHQNNLLNGRDELGKVIYRAQDLEEDVRCGVKEYDLEFGTDISSIGRVCPLMPAEQINDSGAGQHLAGEDKLTEDERRTLTALSTPLKFITANGTTFATHSFQRWHPSLREFKTYIMLKSSPDALSQGRLCALDGWRCVWEPYSFEPTLSKGGITVKHDVKNFVAYLPDDPEAIVTAVPLIGRPPELL